MDNSKPVTITLPVSLLQKFKAYKASTGVSLSGLLRVLLEEKICGRVNEELPESVRRGRSEGVG